MVALLGLAVSFLLAAPALAEPNPLGIVSRQLPSGFDPSKLPASCLQNQCAAAFTKVSSANCTTLDCLCTNDMANALNSCYACVVAANVPGFNSSDAAAAVGGFIDGCNSSGHPITVKAGGSSSSSASGSSSTGTTSKPSSASAGKSLSILGFVMVTVVGAVVLA